MTGSPGRFSRHAARLASALTGWRPAKAGGATALALSLAALLVAPAALAADRAAGARLAFCGSTGPILASSITSPVKLSTCPIQRRQLLMSMGNGVLGAGIYVPPPGRGVANYTLTTHGEYELKAVNEHGTLTVTASYPPKVAPAPARRRDPACSENYFNFGGGFWQSSNAEPTELWFYNESTASRAGLSVSASLADIRAGNYNMTTGQNNCGFLTNAFPVHGGFEGNTSLFANIDSNGDRTAKFPDGQNTVSFGPYDAAQVAKGTLATTVTLWNGNSQAMIEADIYIGSNRGLVDTLPNPCNGKTDLQTVVTHEWGHSYGLAHEYSGPDEVMYPYTGTCQGGLRRHLGEGDYDGMSALYGYVP